MAKQKGSSGSGEQSAPDAAPRAKRAPDPEFAVIRRIGRAVESLSDPAARRRVIKYVLDKLGSENANGAE